MESLSYHTLKCVFSALSIKSTITMCSSQISFTLFLHFALHTNISGDPKTVKLSNSNIVFLVSVLNGICS